MNKKAYWGLLALFAVLALLILPPVPKVHGRAQRIRGVNNIWSASITLRGTNAIWTATPGE